MQRTALEVAQNYELEAKERLRRVNIVMAGLEVIAPKKFADADGVWFAEQDKASVPAA